VGKGQDHSTVVKEPSLPSCPEHFMNNTGEQVLASLYVAHQFSRELGEAV